MGNWTSAARRWPTPSFGATARRMALRFSYNSTPKISYSLVRGGCPAGLTVGPVPIVDIGACEAQGVRPIYLMKNQQ